MMQNAMVLLHLNKYQVYAIEPNFIVKDIKKQHWNEEMASINSTDEK